MNIKPGFNIDLLIEGDKREFEKIFFEFFGLLFSLSFQYTRNKTVSEDMAQDAFVKLWENRLNLKTDSNIRNFLYTVTKNNCLNYLRDAQISQKHLGRIQRTELKYAEESLQKLGNSWVEFDELRGQLHNALEKLPPDLREVFMMNRYEGLTYKQVAVKLNIAEKTVEARISKALVLLRHELKDYLPLFILLLSEQK
jgi:RNA polymerase sigma-70 factor, ECF subfamily